MCAVVDCPDGTAVGDAHAARHVGHSMLPNTSPQHAVTQPLAISVSTSSSMENLHSVLALW